MATILVKVLTQLTYVSPKERPDALRFNLDKAALRREGVPQVDRQRTPKVVSCPIRVRKEGAAPHDETVVRPPRGSEPCQGAKGGGTCLCPGGIGSVILHLEVWGAA